MKGISGKVRGRGRRYHECASCGRRIDLHHNHCFLGNGGWHCNDCGEEMRGLTRRREQQYHRQDMDRRYDRQVLESEGGTNEDQHTS